MIPLKDENPVRTVPVVTVSIIILCIFAYLWQLTAPAASLALAAVPYDITHVSGYAPATLITSLFLHGGILHLAGNILFLWIFGNNIEDAAGHGRFAAFFLITGICAGLLQVAVTPLSRVPMIGASGAVSGIMGAYMILFPRARILTLVFIFIFIRFIRVPAFLFLIIWFALQALNAFLVPMAPDAGGVAFFAHIGGFIAGAVLIKLFQRRTARRYRPV